MLGRELALAVEVRIVQRGKPAAQAFILDGHREGLVEDRVVLGVGDLVRQLVKDQSRDFGVVRV